MTATIGTLLHTWVHGSLVGRDEYGNRYYQARARTKERNRRKRWVIYNGKAEPSKVPAHWHTWLHYTTDTVPEDAKASRYRWQRGHVPNLTGTKHRYLPKGHLQNEGKRAVSAADYTPWNPDA